MMVDNFTESSEFHLSALEYVLPYVSFVSPGCGSFEDGTIVINKSVKVSHKVRSNILINLDFMVVIAIQITKVC
jgi:hypothetical protein